MKNVYVARTKCCGASVAAYVKGHDKPQDILDLIDKGYAVVLECGPVTVPERCACSEQVP